MAVGAEVVLVAPVVGDDVARTRLVGADDLQVVLAGLGVPDPRLDRGPAGAVHLDAGLLERPCHEARAPRVAGPDLRRREVLIDLLAGVRASLLHTQLGLRHLQRRGPGAAPAGARRGCRRGVDHARHRRGRGDRARGPRGRLGTRKKPEAPFLPALEAWAAAAMNWPDWPFLGLRRHRGGGGRSARGGRRGRDGGGGRRAAARAPRARPERPRPPARHRR